MKYLSWLWWLPVISVLSSIVWLVFIFNANFSTLLLTADQQAYQWYQKAQYTKAAESFDDAAFKAAALFKAGEFEKSAAVYATLNNAEARYNQANAQLMMGRYPQAIELYEQALALRPGFLQAQENRAIALARQQLLDQDRENDEGTGGMLAADEIVYDNNNKRGQDTSESSAEQSAAAGHWLDRLQTGPDQFLKHKFSYQYGHQNRHQNMARDAKEKQ